MKTWTRRRSSSCSPSTEATTKGYNAPLMVAAQAGIVESHRGTGEDLDTAAVVKLQPIDEELLVGLQRAADGGGVG